MNTLIISGSARKDGNTKNVLDLLQLENSETVYLIEKDIAHFSYLGTTNDDFKYISEKMLLADRIIFATPVYWYSMSSYMKVFFDRLTELVQIHKTDGRKLKGKHIYLISTSGSPEQPSEFELPFRETAHYLDMIYDGTTHFYFPNEKIPQTNLANKAKKLSDLLNDLK